MLAAGKALLCMLLQKGVKVLNAQKAGKAKSNLLKSMKSWGKKKA